MIARVAADGRTAQAEVEAEAEAETEEELMGAPECKGRLTTVRIGAIRGARGLVEERFRSVLVVRLCMACLGLIYKGV